MSDKHGMLCDHSGKRSVSRATSLLATVTLCGVALIGQIGDKGEPSLELLGILAAVALGPIGLNRYFGESGAEMFAADLQHRGE